jgi:predicted DNA-binding WGR domain protein
MKTPSLQETVPEGWRYTLLDRTDRTQNMDRFYLVGWLPTLFDEGALVRMYGRKGSWQRLRITPYPSLTAAWPEIRRTLRTRMRHHYRMVDDADAEEVDTGLKLC